MLFSEYVARRLSNCKVKDVFGIPGGVILPLIDSFEKEEIHCHLSPSEQSAGFSAIGNSSIESFGVAIFTKGPGFTNMTTAIASAYADSIPSLFITGHELKNMKNSMTLRTPVKQELPMSEIVKDFTKVAITIENAQTAVEQFENALKQINENRPGPVFISVLKEVWTQEVSQSLPSETPKTASNNETIANFFDNLSSFLKDKTRPVLLVGNGIEQTKTENGFSLFANALKIPVLCSRRSSGLLKKIDPSLSMGFIGSNGTRAGNQILDEADCVISIGNKLGFSPNSSSFGNYFENRSLFRVENDEMEIAREFCGFEKQTIFKANLSSLFNFAGFGKLDELLDIISQRTNEQNQWLLNCQKLTNSFFSVDETFPEKALRQIYETLQPSSVASDIGVNERWTANAFFRSKLPAASKLLYTQWMGVVGTAIPQAIGAATALTHSSSQTKKHAIAVVGDYGFQYNVSDLGYISARKLPITIVIMKNTKLRGMNAIQEKLFAARGHMTSIEGGFAEFDHEAIAKAFKLQFFSFNEKNFPNELQSDFQNLTPKIVQIEIEPNDLPRPVLRAGKKLSEMEPAIK